MTGTNTDWNQSTERLEQCILANNMTMDEKHAVFLTLVGPRNYSLVKGLIASDKPTNKAYAALKEELRAHLKPKLMIIFGEV